jgi:hypothetical protein
LIVACLSLHGGRWHAKSEYFVTFLLEIWASAMILPCFWPTNTLPISYLQRSWRELETGVGKVKNGPVFYPGTSKFKIYALHEFRWKWVFFKVKGSGCWAIGGSRHLVLMTWRWRGGAAPESWEPWCCVRSFDLGMVDAILTVVVRILCCMIITVQWNAGI